MESVLHGTPQRKETYIPSVESVLDEVPSSNFHWKTEDDKRVYGVNHGTKPNHTGHVTAYMRTEVNQEGKGRVREGNGLIEEVIHLFRES